MCGIVGVWQLDGRAVDRAAVEAMRDTLVHRGPDDAGLWAEGPVALGHRRLSIIDLSEAGRMPMSSPDGMVQAVFNGEVYNFRTLRAELEAKGHSFHSGTDSEVVLRAYEQWGADCFDRFNGMFAVAVWDGRERRMILARDAAGQKPLYYAYRPGRWFLFASTLAPLIRYAGGELGVDEAVVKDYVRFGFPPGERAMLKDVHTVPPGSLAIAHEDREPGVHRYFDLANYAEQTPIRQGDERAHLDAFRDVMRDAVQSRLVADVPLGAFLSGGVDSSLIVALMAERDPDAVKTYTIGFDQPEFDESEHAARIAFFDEPMADYSALPTLAVSKLAREHVTVALTGDGADEEFGGYKYYLAQRAVERYMDVVPATARAAVAKAARLVPSSGARRILARSGATDAALFFGLGGFYRGATTEAVNRLLGEQNEAPMRVAAFLGAHPLGSSVEAGMLYDATHTLPGAWLHKVDRASMAVSLEARSPFLDRRVLELAFGLPLDMRIRGRHKKYIVRRLLRDYLPLELIERPKQGFTAPVAHWLRNELRSELEGRLSKEAVRRRGFFDPNRAWTLVREHLEGTHDH
ncbi:MAG: asparagine synthase (glutamine-hydrolyzing), partial [Deltaproteobacteria bacterium]|nr:asparagine synthase (glutamine-hydrolyzing) [Deltaproteobacteria bacterium]